VIRQVGSDPSAASAGKGAKNPEPAGGENVLKTA